MTEILAKLTERHAQLMLQVDEHHKGGLALMRERRVTDARLAEIEFAIAACVTVRACTCHPDDNPPVPCPGKFALSECRAAVRTQAEIDRTYLARGWRVPGGSIGWSEPNGAEVPKFEAGLRVAGALATLQAP